MKMCRPTRSMTVMLILLLFFVSLGSAATIIPGEAIVKISSDGESKNILNIPGITVCDSIPEENTYLIRFDASRPVVGIVKMLTRNPNVESAQPNHAYQLPEVQQISIGFPDQGRPVFNLGVNPPTFYGQSGVYSTGLDSAQRLASGFGVTVAVIDNGIWFDHPLMRASRIMSGHDFVNNDSDPSEEPGLMLGHGTFVAGLILLSAPDCRILPLRAFNGDGVGSEFSAAKAIRKAMDLGANVVNMSFGSPDQYPVLASMIDRALSAGLVLVGASGNYGNAIPMYPAANIGVISVGAIDSDDYIADFSNYGSTLDLVAPGVSVYSSMAGEYEWATWSGTSFAAPIVSGSIALVLQRTGQLPSSVVEQHMRQTARSSLAWGGIEVPDLMYGWGVLNAYAAVAEAAKGDLDNSGVVDATDLRILSNYVNSGGQGNGGRPLNVRQCDIDCNGVVDSGDIQALADYLFNGGPAPQRCQR